jgi:hypothetical protein
MPNISCITVNDEVNRTAEFKIYSDATIRNEEEFYNLINPILDTHNSFVIKLIDIKNIDLPFLQLLVSAEKTIKSLEKEVRFEIELASASNNIVANSGIDLSKLFETVELKIANLS